MPKKETPRIRGRPPMRRRLNKLSDIELYGKIYYIIVIIFKNKEH